MSKHKLKGIKVPTTQCNALETINLALHRHRKVFKSVPELGQYRKRDWPKTCQCCCYPPCLLPPLAAAAPLSLPPQ